MEQPRLLICGIFDESGSMMPHLDRHIEGFNAFIADQQASARDTDIKFNCILFNDRLRWMSSTEWKTTDEMISVAEFPTVSEFSPFSRATYTPSGTTALFDAIGTGIKSIDRFLTDDGRPWTVAVVIQTDGIENASRSFTQAQIRQMITDHTAAGWSFTYLGADQDAIQEATRIGIAHHSAIPYSSTRTDVTRLMTEVSRLVTTTSRSSSGDQRQLSVAPAPEPTPDSQSLLERMPSGHPSLR